MSTLRLGTAAALICVIVFPASTATENTDGTKAAMGRIFDRLTGIFALSLDPSEFSDSKNRREIFTNLKSLAAEAEALGGHPVERSGLGTESAFLRRALADDANAALHLFKSKEHEGARIIIRQLTESCLACHSKLPDAGGFDLGGGFLADPRIAQLPIEERVRLEVMSRQFDRALESYETLLASRAAEPAEVYFMGAFEGYLKICLRVRGDAPRAIATLETFARRADVPAYLREYVKTWLEALRGFPEGAGGDDALERARRLVAEGAAAQHYPGDRRGMIHYIAASGLLHGWLDAGPRAPSERCEAYHLLARCEMGISRLSWLSEVEHFLESAILACPGTPEAQQAFATLEEYVLTAYSGSAGLDVPPDVESKLETLWRTAKP